MIGKYFTDRKGSNGINTEGDMKLRKQTILDLRRSKKKAKMPDNSKVQNEAEASVDTKNQSEQA